MFQLVYSDAWYKIRITVFFYRKMNNRDQVEVTRAQGDFFARFLYTRGSPTGGISSNLRKSQPNNHVLYAFSE